MTERTPCADVERGTTARARALACLRVDVEDAALAAGLDALDGGEARAVEVAAELGVLDERVLA